MPPAGGSSSPAPVAETIDALFRQSLQVKGFKGFRAVIDHVCSLRRHKPWNAFLIAVQRPGAIAVASPKDWWERYERRILPGARPIIILQPFGPVRFVYETADTTGKELPIIDGGDLFNVRARPDCIVTDATLPRLFSGFRKSDSIVIQRDDYGFAQAGLAARVHGTDDSQTLVGATERAAFVVRIARRLAPAEAFATLVHELGHIYCGHLGTPPTLPRGRKKRPYWPDRSHGLTTAQCEFEAEATCHVVCQRLGIYPKSAEYLSGYVSKKDWPHISVANIIRAVHRIESVSAKAFRWLPAGWPPSDAGPPESLPAPDRKPGGHELRLPAEMPPDHGGRLPRSGIRAT